MMAIGLASILTYWGNEMLRALESDSPSQSIGAPNKGRLVHGKRLPTSGKNFVTYSRVGALIGRQATHSAVRDAILDAYASLETSAPDTTYMIGETGWPSGGDFAPHRTHQNGLSVDFMVPLRDANGASITMQTWPWNAFGYRLEYDSKGRARGGDEVIDFEAIAEHLYQLDQSARRSGAKITRVIFAPDLRDELFATKRGAWVKKEIEFLPRRAWVRHDDHYHVDFSVRAAPRAK